MEKCKKHNAAILTCNKEHYADICDHIPQCKICVRIMENMYKKSLQKCNWVTEINPNKLDPTKYIAMAYKPRHKLKKGDYATLDIKTGYLIKAIGLDVRFLVIK